jgi:hypothetical protein
VVADGTQIGVWGESPHYGVYGASKEFAVYGVATTVASDPYRGVAVRGVGNADALAGRFDGHVEVYGTLFEFSSAPVHIDHPLEPRNRYLTHAAVSSPDMLNVYSGSVTLDARGASVVRLPRYFEALNMDHRIQLTGVGVPAPNLHVAQEVNKGRFRIAGGAPGQKVFWQVTGVRQDAWARKHRIKPDSLKRPRDRGKYLAPKLFGKRMSDGIGYVTPIKRRRKTAVVARTASPAVPRPRPAAPRLPGRGPMRPGN